MANRRNDAMNDDLWRWRELKTKFLRELTLSEQLFFLKKAKESVAQKGYPVGEDLFNYCYFVTLRERLRLIDTQGGEGYMRFLLVESRKEIDVEVKVYEKRLEERKLPGADLSDVKFIEYLQA